MGFQRRRIGHRLLEGEVEEEEVMGEEVMVVRVTAAVGLSKSKSQLLKQRWAESIQGLGCCLEFCTIYSIATSSMWEKIIVKRRYSLA